MSLKWLWLFSWLTGPTNQNRPVANRFNFSVFSTILMKFGVWTANAPALLLLLPCPCIAPGLLLAYSKPAPGLLMVRSYPAPCPAHPSLAAFIIISSLRLFSARREPPFMVLFFRAYLQDFNYNCRCFSGFSGTYCQKQSSTPPLIGTVISKEGVVIVPGKL